MATSTPRALVLAPHPDDEAIGCGGAILDHVARGWAVEVVFLTSGEAGGHGAPPAETAKRREREAKRAARILGVSEMEFWRQPDGRLRATEPLVGRLVQALTASRPDILYAPHAAEQHPDHRAAARLVRRALERLEGDPPRLRQYEVWTPLQRIDEIVDISEHVDAKRRAIRAYASQCEVLRFDDAALGLARWRGEMHSWPGGPYAEVFRT